MRNKKVYFEFRTKEEGSGDSKTLFIEGFANRAEIKGQKVVDRGQEHIPAGEWKIEEWKKNPIIFFNHDRDMPIGKGVAAKVTDEGLWIKAQISNSDVPEIKKARDLIKEGILQTFSVGIDVENEELAEDKSITLKGVSLLETSVVSIPMNQESFFSISQKSMAETPLDLLESDILEAGGKKLAACVHRAIHAKTLEDKGFDRTKLLDEDGVKEVLAGIKEPDEALIQLFSEMLGLDITAEKFGDDNDDESEDDEETEEDKASDDDELEDEEESEDDKPKQEELDTGEPGKQEEESEKPTLPLGTEDQLTTDLGQPGLQALQQLTVLMGQLIAETQKTSKLLEGMMSPATELAEDEEESDEELPEDEESDEEQSEDDELAEGGDEEGDMDEDDDEEEVKCLDIITSYREKLEGTLSRFEL